jgi:hypothetical protein
MGCESLMGFSTGFRSRIYGKPEASQIISIPSQRLDSNNEMYLEGVSMIKFDKAEKSEYLIFYSELFGFGSFQNRNREWDRLKDLKIKNILRPQKRLEGDNEPMEKNYKLRAEIAKIGMSGFGNWNVLFLQIK